MIGPAVFRSLTSAFGSSVALQGIINFWKPTSYKLVAGPFVTAEAIRVLLARSNQAFRVSGLWYVHVPLRLRTFSACQVVSHGRGLLLGVTLYRSIIA